MTIKENIASVLSTLPEGVKLVAVSKFHPAEMISEAYEAGQRLFGESRAQELIAKAAQLPTDIEWHFIGHLQKNKVKQVVPIAALIHSVDNEGLLEEINRQGEKLGKKVKCLLQIHIAREETKFGFSPEECKELFDRRRLKLYPSVEVVGLMGMATFTDDQKEVETEFESLASLYRALREAHPDLTEGFRELSMGMSDDYLLAVKHGSTLVRIGSKLFGARI